jgi:hypothetical protein
MTRAIVCYAFKLLIVCFDVQIPAYRDAIKELSERKERKNDGISSAAASHRPL